MNQKLFNFSVIIVGANLISILFHIKRILVGTPPYSDFIFICISLFVVLVLFSVANKPWRLGLTFVLMSILIKHFAAIIGQDDLRLSLLLSILSLAFLVPALVFFLKLRSSQ